MSLLHRFMHTITEVFMRAVQQRRVLLFAYLHGVKYRSTKILYLFIAAIVNAGLLCVIPDYYFWFLVILAVGFLILLVVIAIDLFKKTQYWKTAITWLTFGALSWMLGMLSIVIRNYFLGYYSN